MKSDPNNESDSDESVSNDESDESDESSGAIGRRAGILFHLALGFFSYCSSHPRRQNWMIY
jgi:hypothetical protein